RGQNLVSEKVLGPVRLVQLERIDDIDLERAFRALAQLERPQMREEGKHVIGAQKSLTRFPDALALRTVLLRHDREQARFGAVRDVELDTRILFRAQEAPGFVLFLDR